MYIDFNYQGKTIKWFFKCLSNNPTFSNNFFTPLTVYSNGHDHLGKWLLCATWPCGASLFSVIQVRSSFHFTCPPAGRIFSPGS